MPALTRRQLLALAVPVILANAAAPLLGIVDTAVISHTGELAAVGAIALAGIVFSFIFWGFGFLRMGTSGYVAQAYGAMTQTASTSRQILGTDAPAAAPSAQALGRVQPVDAIAQQQLATPDAAAALGDHCLRALLLAAALGLVIIAVQWPLLTLVLTGFDASGAVEAQLAEYFALRIYGAPAALLNFAVAGILIGLSQFRLLLGLQLLLNGVNLLLDLLLVLHFELGVRGIALGTLAAEWSAALLGSYWVVRHLMRLHPQCLHLTRTRLGELLTQRRAWIALFHTNTDILWRTLALLAGFGLFINLQAQLGDEQLAATHLLLQFVTLAAFLLDGFAQVGESQVGQALGARTHSQLLRAMRLCAQCAAISALALAALLLIAGDGLIALLTPITAVQLLAQAQLPWAALYIALAWAAFVLDGFFIGALHTTAMRNTTLVASGLFALAAWLPTTPSADGLWVAFIAFLIARALGLCLYLPALIRQSRNHQIAQKTLHI